MVEKRWTNIEPEKINPFSKAKKFYHANGANYRKASRSVKVFGQWDV